MTIREEIQQLSATVKDLRWFAWSVGGVLVVIWAVLRWPVPHFFDKGGDYPLLAYIGASLAAVGTVAPKILKPLYYAWMSLAFVLGFVMTRVILTVFFFVVLTPVSLVFRVIRRDALQRQMDRDATTYWQDKEYLITDRSRYENFF